MIEALVYFGVLIAALAILIKSSDFFTDAADKIGKKLGMDEFIVGVLIVSLGTSLPELSTSVLSALSNETGIILGNVIGSNIANILLIGGISALFITTLKIKSEIHVVDLPFAFGTVMLLILISIDGKITWIEGLLFLAAFIVYMIYTYNKERQEPSHEDKASLNKINLPKEFLILVISLVFVYYSATYVIKSIINISEYFSIATSIISSSVLAIGTSLPELSVSIQAVRKKKLDMVVGNILGSNVFNILGIAGISSFIATLHYDVFSYFILLPFLFFSTLLFILILDNKTINKYSGILMLIMYASFIYSLVYFSTNGIMLEVGNYVFNPY